MNGPAAQPAARSRLPPGWRHARKRGGSPWRELPHGRHAVVSLGRDGRWRLGLFGGSDGREWWPLAVPDLAMEAEACAAADRAIAARLARERAGPFQLSAHLRRIAALHWQLLGDWLDIVELGVSPGRVAAVARWEFFKCRMLADPAATVDRLTCPDRLIPTVDDLIPTDLGAVAWRPSKAADREACRLAAQWREAGEPCCRDPWGPAVAEWQEAHA